MKTEPAGRGPFETCSPHSSSARTPNVLSLQRDGLVLSRELLCGPWGDLKPQGSCRPRAVCHSILVQKTQALERQVLGRGPAWPQNCGRVHTGSQTESPTLGGFCSSLSGAHLRAQFQKCEDDKLHILTHTPKHLSNKPRDRNQETSQNTDFYQTDL